LSQLAYGAAAAAIAADAGPCQAWPVSPAVTDSNESAAEPNSSANPSQAAAAYNIGAEPAPENISNELISGGNIGKFAMVDLLPLSPPLPKRSVPDNAVTKRSLPKQ